MEYTATSSTGTVRTRREAYFGTQLCFEDEAREVTILGVDVRRSVGDIDGFRFMVDWPGGVDSQPVLSDRQPVPAGYESAVGRRARRHAVRTVTKQTW